MEWTEVKQKPKKQKKPKQSDDDGFYGGAQGGGLKAGPVKQTFGGPQKAAASHGASAVADFDPLGNEGSDEEIKYEKISLDCARAVQKARLEKEWSQAQLAKAVNEKTGLIVDIESGVASYNADVINRIEKALGVSIPRGRGKKKRKPKAPQF